MAPETPLNGSLAENRKVLQAAVGSQRDAVLRDLYFPTPGGMGCQGFILYIAGMTNRMRTESYVIRPLVEGYARGVPPALETLAPEKDVVPTLEAAVRAVARGKVLLQLEGSREVIAFELSDLPHRTVDAPETEVGVSGPREAFTELLLVNLTQLRRRLPTARLRVESLWLGSEGKVEAVIAYVEGLPTDRMLNQVRKRLSQITQDGLQDVTELTEALADSAVTIFPTVQVTERPDIVAHFLMGGRVAVLMENSPRALLMPALFRNFFESVDDFYEWRPYVTFLRLLRFLAFNLAIPLPALYVAFTTYHMQALPTNLTLSLLSQREGVPLPAPVEAVVMTITFEILREAGVRLPKPIGPTVSIVGGLVIGEAAIRSGLTSPAMVLIVSLTAVASFILPSTTLANATTFLRLALLGLASAFGFFGVMLGYVLALTNLAGMTSLGVPYATPLWPMMFSEWKDTFGFTPRPPKGKGAIPNPKMTQEAETYQERGGSDRA